MYTVKADRKITIHNWTAPPPLPEHFEEDLWQMLFQSIQAVKTGQELPFHLEELYRATERLCLYQFSEWTYAKLYQECQEIARETHLELIQKEKACQNPLSNLHSIQDTWSDYASKFLTLKKMFYYLDRTYMMHAPAVLSLWDTGIELFKTTVLTAPVRKLTTEGLLALIESGRKDAKYELPKDLMMKIIELLQQLKIYKECFEDPFLNTSRQYYSSYGQDLMNSATLSVPVYLLEVERCLEFEARLADHLFTNAAHTKSELVKEVERQLISLHVNKLLDVGFEELMREHQKEYLSLLYRLFSKVDAFDPLKSHFAEYVKTFGLGILASDGKGVALIEQVIQFKITMDDIMVYCFNRCEVLNNALKESFEAFLNAKSNKCAEWIAKYLDFVLKSTPRKGIDGTGDDDGVGDVIKMEDNTDTTSPSPLASSGKQDRSLETMVDQVLTLFRFIQGKDIFEAFYKKDLAKRLLLGKSASLDIEKNVLSKLKAECGPAFTSKLEGMFKDMEISKEMQAAFKQSAKYSRGLPHLDMQPSILTAGFWPSYPNQCEGIILPPQLQKYQDAFKRFYLDKHNGRRLAWQHGLEHCIVKAAFSSGSKELFVSVYQAIVLQAFTNSRSRILTVSKLQQITGLDIGGELDRSLLSLAMGKYPILLLNEQQMNASMPPPVLKEDDVVSVNEQFSAKLYRLRINTLQLKETAEEQATTTDQVYQDRQYQIDAAVVRIMKSAKSMSQTQLMTELFASLKFPIRAADIKKRIDSLIEREYLQRDKDNQQVYNYMA